MAEILFNIHEYIDCFFFQYRQILMNIDEQQLTHIGRLLFFLS